MATHAPKVNHGLSIPQINHVDAAAPLRWLSAGWRDFREHPGPSLAYGAMVALIGLLILMAGASKPLFLLTATTGYLLIAPLLAAGIYELTRQREQGKAHPTLMDSFQGLRKDASGVVHYGIVLAISFLIWERVATVSFALFYGGQIGSFDSFLENFVLSGEFMSVLAVWTIAGAILATIVFSLSVVGIPMIVDKNVDIVTAMVTSVKAAQANKSAMMVWAGIIVALSLIGWATMMVGLLVIMPLLGHATWCAYRELVGK